MNLIEKAREFAIKKHANQLYGNDPYIVHLDDVYEIYNELYPNMTSDILGPACYLHDVLEDTDCTFEEIWKEFGWEVAQLVFLVTDESGTNRHERKQKTYPKIVSTYRSMLLKLFDRIANFSAAKKNNPKLFEMYQKEHAEFINQFTSVATVLKDIAMLINRLEVINEK